MYEKIHIHETDFTGKFLLKVDDHTMYVGYITKEIVNLLKKETKKNDIVNTINESYDLNINSNEIDNIINKIDVFLLKERKTQLLKLIKILNPNKLNFPTFIKNLFKDSTVYICFFLFLIINTLVFSSLTINSSTSILDSSVLFFFLLIILFLHELGHSISARNYKIKTNEIGFGIYIIFPVFYIDLGEAWTLNVKKRTIINLSGIYTQLIVGIIIFLATLVFKNNFLLTNLFYVNFVIIILNFNPFLKFDGYWIISDLLKEKDLITKSNEIFKTLLSFKFPEENMTIIVYAILRLIFILWVIYVVVIKLNKLILNLLSNDMGLYDYILISLIAFLIYKKIIKQ